jgi:hypothetical protein
VSGVFRDRIEDHIISSSSRRASASNVRIRFLSAIAPALKRPCLRAFRFAIGAPDPAAPPCMRHRLLPPTAGARQAPPDRVLAPQRGLAIIGPGWLS